MSVADRLNKLSTDITNAYTSIENKGGTTPANKNTNNLPTAINSIEVIESATAEGESLSLANTKAMPYNDYVVEGKSEQETRSGKNLFDYNSYTYDKTILNAYRFIEIKNTKPSTNYVISNYDSLVNSEFTNVYLAFGTSMSEINFANLVGADYVRFYTKTDGKMYLCTYASNWTEELWNTFISYFENAQLEERNNTNLLRTIRSFSIS